MLTKSAPLADLMIGLDNTYLPTAIQNCLLMEHSVSNESFTATSMEFYDGPLALPFDEGDVCLNYDEDALAAANMSVPTSLWNLTEAEWNGKMTFPSPMTSSPGRAFLAATVDYFGHSPGNESWRRGCNWWNADCPKRSHFHVRMDRVLRHLLHRRLWRIHGGAHRRSLPDRFVLPLARSRGVFCRELYPLNIARATTSFFPSSRIYWNH